ncbi:MAG: PucR family transcriptional regulator [Candidatus Dormibacteria bacterium]
MPEAARQGRANLHPVAPGARATPPERRELIGQLIESLEGRLDDLASSIVREMRVEIAAYSAIESQRRVEALDQGVRAIATTFFAVVKQGRRLNASEAQLLTEVAADPSEHGIALESLLSGIRLAMRVGWQYGVGQARALPGYPAVLEALGDLAVELFDFIDDLSTALTEGYLRRERERLARRERDRQSIVDDLLVGDFPSDADMQTVALEHGLDLSHDQVLLVPTAAGGDARWRLRDAVRGFVKDLPSVVAVPVNAGAQAHAVLLAPLLRPDDMARHLDIAERIALASGVLVLATQPLRGAGEIHRAYQRVSGELALAVSLRGGKGLVHADELVVYGILGGDAGDQRAFIDQTLGPILVLPASHSAPILETLEALHVSGGNVESAASSLHVHAKTIRYRLGRLTEFTGMKFHHPPDRFRVELAIHLLKLHPPKDPTLHRALGLAPSAD